MFSIDLETKNYDMYIGLNDENTSALITDPTDPEAKFVVMPMRL